MKTIFYLTNQEKHDRVKWGMSKGKHDLSFGKQVVFLTKTSLNWIVRMIVHIYRIPLGPKNTCFSERQQAGGDLMVWGCFFVLWNMFFGVCVRPNELSEVSEAFK